MSHVHLRNLGIPRNQPEDRQGLFRTRRPGTGNLVNSGGWQDTEENHTHSAIHLPIQQKPQTTELEGYGSSSLAPPTLKDLFQRSMDKNRFKLASHWEELGSSYQRIFLKQIHYKDLMVITKGLNPNRPFKHLGEGNQDKGESSHYPSYRRKIEPDRAYSNSSRLTRSSLTQLFSGFAPFRQ
ncbi:hypothetical protein O181_016363 [Austropuccinia psidii MF-1]|uniref:Uncharacterized protein n=1 Tax=Austropuccinia psidii MF-1 TaxID=1389203 RepID=A0A9Q3GQT0_9BASI|nr:hypothetical protein [Austropuccinia psidii MF-1]